MFRYIYIYATNLELGPSSIALRVCSALKTLRNAIILSRTNGTGSFSPNWSGSQTLTTSIRGLPLGYVNKLEARLAETEAALFHILSQVDGADSQTTSLAADEISSPPSSSSTPGQNSKPERVREWDRLPLQTVGDIRLWYRSKAVQCCGHAAADLPSRASQDTPGDQPVGDLAGAHAGRSAQSSQLATAVPGAIITVESPKPDSSRANELSRSQYSLYF